MLNENLGDFTLCLDLDYSSLTKEDGLSAEELEHYSSLMMDDAYIPYLPGSSAAMTFFMAHMSRTDSFLVTRPELVEQVASFVRIIDARSPYTAEHSAGVARMAGFLAEKAGLDAPTCSELEIAGLLHDIGKLCLPSTIIEKQTELDSQEVHFMRHHSYASFGLLHTIGGLENIALWAVNHHELLDGSGYPFRKKAENIDLASRVIAVADIFQAMIQDRPYRRGLLTADVVGHLEQQAACGKLDQEVVRLVGQFQDECYSLAV